MRIASAIVLALLAASLTAALAYGASPTVTTALTIPFGAIAGFNFAVTAIDAHQARRRRRRAERHARRMQPPMEVIVLHPVRAPSAERPRQLLIAA